MGDWGMGCYGVINEWWCRRELVVCIILGI